MKDIANIQEPYSLPINSIVEFSWCEDTGKNHMMKNLRQDEYFPPASTNGDVSFSGVKLRIKIKADEFHIVKKC